MVLDGPGAEDGPADWFGSVFGVDLELDKSLEEFARPLASLFSWLLLPLPFDLAFLGRLRPTVLGMLVSVRAYRDEL